MKKTIFLIGVNAVISIVLVLAAMWIFHFGFFGGGGRSVETILDLNFDAAEDADWIALDDMGERDIRDFVEDGFFKLSGRSYFKYNLGSDMIFHMRLKAGDVSPEGQLYRCEAGNDGGIFGVSAANKRQYFMNVSTDAGNAGEDFKGSAMLARGDYWADIIVYFDPRGKEIRFFVSNADNGQDICYAGYTLPEGVYSDQWEIVAEVFSDWGEAVNPDDLTADIDFIRVSEGDIGKYLKDNIPAYSTNKQRVDAFLKQPATPFSELDFSQQG